MDANMRRMLVSLSHLIGPEDLKAMKFCCKDIIPTKVRDGIQSSIDLFEKLEERGKLTPEDLSFLKFLLETTCCGRTDMLDIFRNYVENTRKADDARLIDETNDLTPTFAFLVKNLGREYLMVLRRLGVQDSVLDRLIEENQRNIQEVIHKALLHWYRSHPTSARQVDIVTALQAEKRNDLAVKIVKGDL